jgi:hypothetical protein
LDDFLYTLDSVLKITEVAQIFGLLFHSTSGVLTLKKWLDYILGDFFANSSGHPGGLPQPNLIIDDKCDHKNVSIS